MERLKRWLKVHVGDILALCGMAAVVTLMVWGSWSRVKERRERMGAAERRFETLEREVLELKRELSERGVKR